MPQHSDEPDWLSGEVDRADKLHKSGQEVNNPTARRAPRKPVNEAATPPRTLKGFRIREDYQQRYDVLVATMKHTEGKKGPELIEEALDLLFRKYDK